MSAARFKAELLLGHKGVTVVMVPFDPEAVWRRKPHRLAGRRHGWLVEGTANGAKFRGYVGERWGRFFIELDPALREAAAAQVGHLVAVVVKPSSSAKVWALAEKQSEITTEPGKARADAIQRKR